MSLKQKFQNLKHKPWVRQLRAWLKPPPKIPPNLKIAIVIAQTWPSAEDWANRHGRSRWLTGEWKDEWEEDD